MSTAESRPSEGFGLWLVVSAGVVVGAALFSAARTKPPVIFAAGFGLAMGLLLRYLAGQMTVSLDRRVTLSVVILTAVGFALGFGLGYRRAAVEWDKLHPTGPGNPLATALLKSFPNSDPAAMIAAQQRFTLSDYLSQRVPNWPTPWPEVLCGAEWVGCVLIAGLCVGISRRKRVARDAATEPEASATGCSEPRR